MTRGTERSSANWAERVFLFSLELNWFLFALITWAKWCRGFLLTVPSFSLHLYRLHPVHPSDPPLPPTLSTFSTQSSVDVSINSPRLLLSSHFSPPSCAAGGEMCQTASRVLPDSSGSSMTFVQRCEGVELCCGWTSALNTFRVGSSSQQGHFLTWHYWVRNSVISTLEIFNDY